jgi:SAM-dependent methyltransferase
MQLGRKPHLYRPSSQLVTRRQLNQKPARYWSSEMRVPLTITRKTWERIYVVQALQSRGCVAPGSRGLGFGVGADPMIPAMVNHGCEITATDYGQSEFDGWGTGLNLDPRNVAGAEAMERQVNFRDVDMNSIPEDLRGFDFAFSCGSLEHIGGLAHGFEFVERAMDCLRPGGFAVHTTELNIGGGDKTLDLPNLGFYLPPMVDSLIERLTKAGHSVAPMNYEMGSYSEDTHIAERPYPEPCLKIRHSGYTVTSMGLVIQAKGEGRSLPAVGPILRGASEFVEDGWRAARRRLPATLRSENPEPSRGV